MDDSRESYFAWIELAERRLGELLESDTVSDSVSDSLNSEPIQLREVASIVALIKALIDVRRRLETWQNDGEEFKASAAGDTTDEEIFELMERIEPRATGETDEGEMPV